MHFYRRLLSEHLLTKVCAASLASWLVGLTACQQQHVPSRVYFDEAENAYRAGNYDLAVQQYEYFLKQNPDPQLARLAERRKLSITREIDNVMGQKTGFRPKRVVGDTPSEHVPSQQPHIFQSNNSLKLPPEAD